MVLWWNLCIAKVTIRSRRKCLRRMMRNLISCNDRGVEFLTFRRRLLILTIHNTSSRHEYHGVM